MNISYTWIKSLLPGLSETPQEIADILAMQGAPVDSITDVAALLRDIRIARVVEAGRHPNADRLSLCKVDPGNGEILQVVCGAPNVRAGGVYPFAPVGAQLPGDVIIRKSKIRGEESQGMLCSARELGLGREHDGIMELEPDTPIGASLIDVLMLDDARIEVDVTPNRPDLLSHLGVAREIGARVGIEPRLPAIRNRNRDRVVEIELAFTDRKAKSNAEAVEIHVADPDLCPRYLGLVIRGVKVGPSPAWLAGPLRAAGLRPISNVVDATNYVLHELGQPLHAFDLKKVGDKVVVRRAQPGEKITTLDDIERTLGGDMLVIADSKRPIAVAGVMGGADTEVDNDTTDILLECALFNAASVRATRRALGLSTDASYRFERGVDPDMMELALRRAAEIILATAGGTAASTAADAGINGGDQRKTIDLRTERVAQVLGVRFDAKQIIGLLSPLGFDVTGDDDTLTVRVPGHRSYDVTREEDLIEEIARRHGYDNFPADLRAFRPTAVPDDVVARREDALRDVLIGMGLLESRTLAFAPEGAGDVALMLPLSSAEGMLRNAIVPSLLRRAEFNYARGQRHIRLFEIGTAFFKADSGAIPHEERHVAAVITGGRTPPHWSGDAPVFDAWDLQGILSALAARLGFDIEPANGHRLPAWADDTAAWVLTRNGVNAGCGARVSGNQLDAPAWADPAYAFEVNIDLATDPAPRFAVQSLPSQPAVERDLALLVPQGVTSRQVLDTVAQSAGPLLENAVPFDVYRGKGVADNLRSVAIRLRFRAQDRTLKDDEVDRAVGRVLNRLKEEHGIDRRS